MTECFVVRYFHLCLSGFPNAVRIFLRREAFCFSNPQIDHESDSDESGLLSKMQKGPFLKLADFLCSE